MFSFRKWFIRLIAVNLSFKYNRYVVTTQSDNGKGGVHHMLFLAILPLIITVVAYWICLPIGKWLDSREEKKRDN